MPLCRRPWLYQSMYSVMAISRPQPGSFTGPRPASTLSEEGDSGAKRLLSAGAHCGRATGRRYRASARTPRRRSRHAVWMSVTPATPTTVIPVVTGGALTAAALSGAVVAAVVSGWINTVLARRTTRLEERARVRSTLAEAYQAYAD